MDKSIVSPFLTHGVLSYTVVITTYQSYSCDYNIRFSVDNMTSSDRRWKKRIP